MDQTKFTCHAAQLAAPLPTGLLFENTNQGERKKYCFSLGQFFAKSKLGVKTHHKPVIIQCAIVVEENLHYYQDGQIRLTYRTQTIANSIFIFEFS